MVTGCQNRAEVLGAVGGCGQVDAAYQPRGHDAPDPAEGRAWCVRFASEGSADAACALNGRPLGAPPGGPAGAGPGAGPRLGRTLGVSRATRRNMGRVEQPNRVFVSRLPGGVTDEEILALLGHGTGGSAGTAPKGATPKVHRIKRRGVDHGRGGKVRRTFHVPAL